MWIGKEDFHALLETAGFSITQEQYEAFAIYASLLVEWNNKMNLTAITQPFEIAEKHFLDSLLLLRHVSIPEGGSFIDVGCGAGFPSMPIKIVRPDIALTQLDSLKKRLTFLQAVHDALGIQVQLVHARAEEAAHRNEYRECYDVATARAVAELNVLAEYCLPYVRVGGVFAAMKGPGAEQELDAALPAIKLLGGEVETVENDVLPSAGSRTVIVVRKTSHVSTKYPRNSGKINKKPL